MFLSNLSIKRPVFATVLMLALVVLGIFSYRRLAIDLMPDVELPWMTVVTELPGASAEAVEREVTRKIEEAVNTIPGVKHIYSTSRESFSTVIVEFELEIKLNEASQEVRAKINSIRNELPEQMKEPVIQKMEHGSLPVVSLAIRSDALSARDLTTLADRRIKRRIENIGGVGKVRLVGASQREVQIELDPARIEALGLGVGDVLAGIAEENVNTPLGRLVREGTESPVRIEGKPALVGGFESMVIGSRGGHPVTLGEVATVVDGIEEQRDLALVNGVPAVAIDVLKQSKTNTVAVADDVKEEIERLAAEMPPGTRIEVVRDASIFIREAVADVQHTLVIGGFLTILIVFCFLNSWRSTVITGLTLPISVISSFIIMYFLGMTLNTLTLMALSLAIGLLIDDAIVVRENIVRHLERGQGHFEAARDGTAEIGLAVMATTASIMAVFIPVAFMKGIVGRFFFQFGMTVAWAVLISLFVSFTLDPMLSSRWYDPDVERKGKRHVVARLLDHFNGWFDRTADRYKDVIAWSLDHRRAIAGVAVAAFVAGLGVFALLESEFFPRYDHGEFTLRFRTAPDGSIEETKGRLVAVLGVLEGFDEIDRTYAAIAPSEGDTVQQAMVYVHLVPKGERARSQQELMPAIREKLASTAGIVLSVEEDPEGGGRKPLMLLVRGEDIPTLKRYAAAIKEKLYAIPGIVDLDATLENDQPEYRLTVDRQRARSAGIGSGELVETIGALVGGTVISTYEDETGEAVDVRVRLPRELREDIRQVEDLRIPMNTRSGPALVPIADLVSVERATAPSEISRQDLSRQVVLSANLDDLALGTAAAKALETAATVPMQPGYSVRMSGDTEIMEESFRYLGEALVLAIVFVYLILAAQFESFIDPLAIMLSLPLSIVGMAGMLLLTRDTINIISLIGLILLMGLVTKNAILLVDFAKVLRRRGMDRREALITAGRTRLRPIMMTTLAMIFGMTPLALGLGEGAEMRAPMARAVIGGLITSTLLTLIVVPVVYSFLDDLGERLRQRWAGAVIHEDAETDAPRPKRLAGAAKAGTTVGLALILALAPAANGQQPLTLERAIAIAMEKNRDLQSAREYQRWVEGKYLEERAAALPQVGLRGAAISSSDETFQAIFGEIYPAEQQTFSGQADLSQVLFAWGKVGAAIRAAEEGIASGEQLLEMARQRVVRDVTVAFCDVLVARELESIAKATLEQRERHLAAAERRYELGVATDYDVLAARVAVENARPQVIRAGGGVRRAHEWLRLVLAEPELADEVVGSLEAPLDPVPDVETVTGDALEQRPDLRELAHRIGVYEQIVKIERAANKPRLDLRASWGWNELRTDPFDVGAELWSAGVYLSFDAFDGWRTAGRVLQATSDLETQRIEMDRARDEVVLEARTSVDALAEATEVVKALSGTVEQATRLLAMAEQGYELGVTTRIEVDDASLELRLAEANLARARRDHRVALVNLAWVQGAL